MTWLRRIWHELVRPRGPRRHRFYRVGRRSRSGIALLMTISSIMLLTILVTEIVHSAVVRINLAGQHRDEVKAEAIAQSGVQFYRLVLMASKAIGRNPMILEYGSMLGVNADTLWQMIPFINTQLMRMLFVTDGDVEEDDVAELKEAGGLSEAELEASREGSSLLKRNFLDFDGDFAAQVRDEARFIYVGKFDNVTSLAELLENPNAKQIMGLMAREEYTDWFYDHNIDKTELIANLADWTDPDDVRLFQGGYEDSLYDRLDSPYKPKNAPFDTRQEIRLVDGWHHDQVWEKVGQHLTIYGDGKVNVNSAKAPVIRALFSAFAEYPLTDDGVDLFVQEFLKYRGMPMAEGGVYFSSPQGFEAFVEGENVGLPLDDAVQQAITTESNVFRVHSTGVVGNARAEIFTVMDFTEDASGKVVFWRVY